MNPDTTQPPSSALTTTAPAAPAADKAPAVRERANIRVVENKIALYDTAKFEHMSRIAAGMARASLIPEHLMMVKGASGAMEFLPMEQIQGNCLLIVNQAMRWDIDPFALAAESYVVKGKLGFQGKAIQAVVEDQLGRKLKYRYSSGKGDELAIVVYAIDDGREVTPEAKALLVALCENDDKSALADLQDEHGIRAVRLSVAQAKTTNDIWRKDPEQKLVYSGSLKWARRYEPGIIMGIRSDDDLERETANNLAEIPKAILPAAPGTAAGRTVVDNSPEVTAPGKKVEPKPKASKPATASTPAPTATATPDPAKPTDKPAGTAPAAEPVKESPAPAAEEAEQSPFGSPPEPEAPAAPAADEPEDVKQIRDWATSKGATEANVLELAIKYKFAPPGAKSIGDIPPQKRKLILGDLDNATAALKTIAAKGDK